MFELSPRRRRRMWQILRYAIGLALGVLVLNALNGQRGDLIEAVNQLGRVKLEWVVVAAVIEIFSYIALGALQSQLLEAADVSLGVPFATSLSFASGAISSSLPGGPVFASIFTFRQYRRKGADGVVAVWALIGTLVFEAVALSLVATAGVGLAIQEGASYNLIGVTIATLVLFAAVDALVWQRRWLVWFVQRSFTWSRRRFGRPRREVYVVMEELTARLASVRLGRRELLRCLLFSAGFWACDCAALVASFGGVGAPVPWRGLLLAYGAGQLAANLPITPGGLGVVEGSLTVALVAFGGAEINAVTAVLLYRIISFWGPLVVGWCMWTVITFRQRYLKPVVDFVEHHHHPVH